MNLNVDESIRDNLRELCEKVQTVDGRPISFATAVTNWVEASKKAGYLLGLMDVATTKPANGDMAEVKEAIASLTDQFKLLENKVENKVDSLEEELTAVVKK
jgi:hypothetical protein